MLISNCKRYNVFKEIITIKTADKNINKQKELLNYYEKLFKTQFPKTAEQLGIVYTPVEITDFILQSVSDILQKEFNKTLSDKNVNIFDPCTGTGIFITRLLQGGFINPRDLKRKYENELFANEITTLAHKVAKENIEHTYYELTKEKKIFKGLSLTDTFEENTKNDDTVFNIIIGNPPYSIGQKSENDNAKNQKYKNLDNRILETYAHHSKAKQKKGLYDSYIKAFRHASDKLNKNGGIIGFITNSGWLDSKGMDGFRKCLENEFDKIYVLNLRGATRGKDKISAQKEGQNVFDILTGVAITILIKKPQGKKEKTVIYYSDIGENLSKKEKLEKINDAKSILSKTFAKELLTSNEHGDWLNKRKESFETFCPLGDKNKNNKNKFFELYSCGLTTNRDAWVYNFSKNEVIKNTKSMLSFYNQQRKEYQKNKSKLSVEDFIDTDSTKISWTRQLKKDLALNKEKIFDEKCIYTSLYRPFQKQWVYFSESLNECRYQQAKIYPEKDIENLCIVTSGMGASKNFSVIMTKHLPCLDLLEKSMCYPLYWYEKNGGKFVRHDGITDYILNEAQKKYGKAISKEDIFYYIYGFLHSKNYRENYSYDLKKLIPRLPLVDSADDFWTFSKAGKELAELHLNYETIKPLADLKITGIEKNNFEIDKMVINKDKSIKYNDDITISDIPKETFDYIINGKSAVEWIVDRYKVSADKKSLLKNNPNNWSNEHNTTKYVFDLLLSVITLSCQTQKIVNNLPKAEF